ncbi:dihydrofolate reductase family protein [Enteractinococcus coprophilus]|uniref:dihydrofolate reductase family protein n=1 Tax=Enteractinococcus coprophilus TaxID=1027633 RepID=UPI00364D0C7C
MRELTLSDIRHIVARNNGITQIFGPFTAAEALRAGIVDRLELFIVPIMIGQGRRALPEGAYRKTETHTETSIRRRYRLSAVRPLLRRH